MLAKLTLTVDEEVVSRAKEYARERHRSVSRLVEDYLRGLAVSEGPKPGRLPDAPITSSLVGMFSSGYRGESDRELLEAALLESMK